MNKYRVQYRPSAWSSELSVQPNPSAPAVTFPAEEAKQRKAR
jgi:hypothetical protein